MKLEQQFRVGVRKESEERVEERKGERGDRLCTQFILVIFLVTEMPSFLKTPMDLTIRTGAMARLECAAEGHPVPQISWQKDGGTDFPAARERRMHVMPEDDVFFIANVKIEDMGIYSCMAQNIAGGLSANASLTVLGMYAHCAVGHMWFVLIFIFLLGSYSVLLWNYSWQYSGCQ